VGGWWGDSFKKLGLEDQNNCKDRKNPHRMLRGKKMLAKVIKAVIQEVAKECHCL